LVYPAGLLERFRQLQICPWRVRAKIQRTPITQPALTAAEIAGSVRLEQASVGRYRFFEPPQALEQIAFLEAELHVLRKKT
jgi:hypothetical protein